MKVCHLTSVHPYYDIRTFIKECQYLSSAGYETHLVATDCREGLIVIFGSIMPERRREAA
ncbi:hypothetical protein BGM26_17740 [Bacillus sp. FJAT-29790]|uniref:hypothetical protein n=1 Tax=Bacillus sp. FJAT-29790 TaxID=1895002 RepID=UPI001C21B223|nr:hypothetical protein [Bacillus sp. FJAT-29790]MBU8880797.1 hypothetical protein [Bacillus sp. FJAT-29790]